MCVYVFDGVGGIYYAGVWTEFLPVSSCSPFVCNVSSIKILGNHMTVYYYTNHVDSVAIKHNTPFVSNS